MKTVNSTALSLATAYRPQTCGFPRNYRRVGSLDQAKLAIAKFQTFVWQDRSERSVVQRRVDYFNPKKDHLNYTDWGVYGETVAPRGLRRSYAIRDYYFHVPLFVYDFSVERWYRNMTPIYNSIGSQRFDKSEHHPLTPEHPDPITPLPNAEVWILMSRGIMGLMEVKLNPDAMWNPNEGDEELQAECEAKLSPQVKISYKKVKKPKGETS